MTDEYKRLNPDCKKSMYISNVISFIIIFAIAYGINWYLTSIDYGYLEQIRLIGIAILAIILIYYVVAPLIYYRYYRYTITSDKVDVRYGVIIHHHEVVPIERIHQVEVTKGPINNIFGLADVTITTAGGTADISYLEGPEADRIADELNAYINRILKDRH